ncbi:Ribokinase-like protein [Neohortaea acidophila]|uniref:Ribokinase-like protein n=1 Tax=Neohortaea acidophila TaxID=245834 RepID=A0A6A6PMZ1_9PEZI|nr:Ribokinase-like protein [Neohortaea acidophila]KAF2481004.1 Ribokinase-like protein [Neohortaea acidophila]
MLVCVGACAIDTILTMPHYPEEDSKLRALSFRRRRGGNTPNTLEVLQQLIESDHGKNDGQDKSNSESDAPLYLIATLPAKASADTSNASDQLQQRSRVDLSHCIYREESSEAVSSYIIASQATSSRTILNHNALEEMTFDEFVSAVDGILRTAEATGPAAKQRQTVWFHFEGRIPQTTLQCIRYLRSHGFFNAPSDMTVPPHELVVSVELEKPGREGLQELAYEADVVFYSKAWARGQGYTSAEDCLKQQSRHLSHMKECEPAPQKTLICPWGEHGATARSWKYTNPPSNNANASQPPDEKLVCSPAYIVDDRAIVDSTGAGDTFIAGVLFGILCRDGRQERRNGKWSLKDTLDFANGLAGRKILQDGFAGLDKLVSGLRDALDGVMSKAE